MLEKFITLHAKSSLVFHEANYKVRSEPAGAHTTFTYLISSFFLQIFHFFLPSFILILTNLQNLH